MPKGGFWPRENSESGTEGSLCRTWKMTRDARDTLGRAAVAAVLVKKQWGVLPLVQDQTVLTHLNKHEPRPHSVLATLWGEEGKRANQGTDDC